MLRLLVLVLVVRSDLRGSRQAFYGDTDVPVIKVDPDSPEGAKIAQQISALFREGGAGPDSSSPPPAAGFAAINRVDMTVRGQADSSAPAYTTPFVLNINTDLELEHGRPSKVRVPQGELLLMYIPQIRGPTGLASVEVSHDQLRELLTETDSPSSLVMLPSGGLLLMSLSPYTDTEPRSGGERDEERREPALAKTKVYSEETKPLETYSRKRGNIQTRRVTTERSTTQFKYPSAWKDTLPQFPFVPEDEEEVEDEEKEDLNVVSAWENGEMPVFPFTSAGKKYPPSNSSTESTVRTRDPVYSLVSRRPLLSGNQIEVHRPVFRRTTLPPVSAQQRLELEDLYQRLKMNFEKSNQDVNLKKRLRKDDQPQLGFDNVNVVIPGRFNPQPVPNGVSQCKKDSSTNGTRVCSSPVQNNCQGGFKIGGNCNGQERLDGTKLPQSEFQMGDEQISNSDTRFVPFTAQQTNMNMAGSTNTRIVPPPNFGFQVESGNQFLSIRTTTRSPPSTRRPTTSPPATTTMSPNDELVHRVMNMDPPELADALMDPMMMAMGTMLAMSGAYMAMVLQETAAANALSLAVAGKKKKK